MEPLARQLRELPKRLLALPSGARWAMGAAALLLAAIAIAVSLLSDGGSYQYAFTNLTPEDSGEAASTLKGAGIGFRMEAGGSALAVPASKVHEARLLLAAAGLPRGGGVGFELFDRGDLGVSDFTQRVNLRRATEGELARTIGHLAAVRSARVHLTLPERSLYREEDRKSAAAVVLNLQPGRAMQERELAGIRHLVASAVSGLDPGSVTIVDGRGTVLSGDQSEGSRVAGREREIEGGLEQRIVELLEPAVGHGAVVAKVTAQIDSSEVESTADKYDPDTTALRSSRKVTELVVQDGSGSAGVAGAAANQPMAPTASGAAGGGRIQTSREDDVKNFEVAKVVTRTLARAPRVMRVSVAVLVDGINGKPRSAAELKRLGDLARYAVGFDEARGDRFEITSEPFVRGNEAGYQDPPLWSRPETVRVIGLGLLGLALLAAVGILALRGRGRADSGVALLKPGARVGDLQAAMDKNKLGEGSEAGGLPDAGVALRDRARELTHSDPSRAAHLLRAWIASDAEPPEGRRG
jgi:flagellar M-ring protein FliF